MLRQTPHSSARFVAQILTIAALAVMFTAATSSDADAKRVRTTKTNVDTTPTAAEVFLVASEGETPLGMTPLKNVRLPRGTITLRFKKDGYRDLIETVEIGRKRQSFVFNLIRIIKPATLEFMALPEFHGAELKVDGKVEGTVPSTISVPPGRHQAFVKKPGYQTWERWFTVSEGQKVTFDVVLTKEVAPTGSILVASTPSGASIRLNGAPKGTTPGLLKDLVEGKYLVTVDLKNYKSYTATVIVKSGQEAKVDAKLESDTGGLGTVKIQTDVDGAEVYIDGEAAGPAPVSKKLKAGRHVVEARAEGFTKAMKEIDVKDGEVNVVQLSLKEATAKSKASVRVIANVPGAQVRIDGGEPEPAPLLRNDLSPGTHFVTVEARGYARWEMSINLKPGKLEEVVAKLDKAGRIEIDVDGPEPAEVFIDGKLAGKTPFIKEDIKVGTYDIEVKRVDGKTEKRRVAIGTAKSVALRIGFNDKEGQRGFPFSGQAINTSTGAVDMHTGFPWLLGARITMGVYDNMDVSVAFRSAFNVTNEFEVKLKYQFIAFNSFALAAQVGIGGGIGAEDRSTFLANVRALITMLIGQKAAVTLRLGMNYYNERINNENRTVVETPDDTPVGNAKDRYDLASFRLGLSVEVKVADDWNFFLTVDGDPVPLPGDRPRNRRRWLLQEGWSIDTQVYGVIGMSWLF